jgi:hypothetical protein
MASDVRCVICGGRCPLACRCPECHQQLCDGCYLNHFATDCPAALAEPLTAPGGAPGRRRGGEPMTDERSADDERDADQQAKALRVAAQQVLLAEAELEALMLAPRHPRYPIDPLIRVIHDRLDEQRAVLCELAARRERSAGDGA